MVSDAATLHSDARYGKVIFIAEPEPERGAVATPAAGSGRDRANALGGTGDNSDGMRRIIREREPVRPSTRLTQVAIARTTKVGPSHAAIANDLDWIVMKCLEKDRTRRYEAVAGLVIDKTAVASVAIIAAVLVVLQP